MRTAYSGFSMSSSLSRRLGGESKGEQLADRERFDQAVIDEPRAAGAAGKRSALGVEPLDLEAHQCHCAVDEPIGAGDHEVRPGRPVRTSLSLTRNSMSSGDESCNKLRVGGRQDFEDGCPWRPFTRQQLRCRARLT